MKTNPIKKRYRAFGLLNGSMYGFDKRNYVTKIPYNILNNYKKILQKYDKIVFVKYLENELDNGLLNVFKRIELGPKELEFFSKNIQLFKLIFSKRETFLIEKVFNLSMNLNITYFDKVTKIESVIKEFDEKNNLTNIELKLLNIDEMININLNNIKNIYEIKNLLIIKN